MKSVTFSIPLVHAKQRARIAKHGGVYTPRETKAAEDLIAWYSRAARETLTGPVRVTVTFTTRKQGDCDNFLKTLLDGMQKGKLFTDDRQVRQIDAQVNEGSPEETRVTVEEIR